MLALTSAWASILGLIVTVVQWLAGRGGRSRSTTPLVIAQEDPAFAFKGDHAPGGVRMYITVDRAPAFNVSFGMQMDGVKVPYHTDPAGYRWGRQERQVSPGERYPVKESAYIQIPWWLGRWPHGDRSFRQRILWARYQDEHGRSWETLNPADEGLQMVGPRRVWARRLVEYQETQRRAEVKRAADREEHSGGASSLPRRR